MKKMKFWGVCFSLCLMAATTLFTSCGGDDDEIDPTDPIVKVPSQFNYVEPFLQWGASKEEVNNYMQNQKGYTKEECGEYSYIYTVAYYNDQAVMLYTIHTPEAVDFHTTPGLHSVAVSYFCKCEPEEVINKLENLYGCKFEIGQTSENGVILEEAANTVVINGSECHILVSFVKSEAGLSITIYYIGKDEL